MIHVNEQLTTENSLNYSYEWAKYLKEHNYMVVLDDAHKLFHSKEGKIFLQQIRADQEWVILLASQPPPQKDDTTKNLKNKFLLTEIPHKNAVKQLENCFQLTGKQLAQITPPLQASYFAYRMWFYLGGNLRAFKAEILSGDLASHQDYFFSAHEVVKRDQYVDPQSTSSPVNKFKNSLFRRTYDYLSQDLNLQL